MGVLKFRLLKPIRRVFKRKKRKKRAFVIIDMEGNKPISCIKKGRMSYREDDIDANIEAVAQMIRFYQDHGIPIIFVKDSSDADIYAELSVVANDPIILNKNGVNSGFENAQVREFLDGFDSLIVAGLDIGVCFRRTIISALIRGFTIHTSKDMIFSVIDREDVLDEYEQVERLLRLRRIPTLRIYDGIELLKRTA